MIDEQISPELVLVDPELAARVRPFAVAGPKIVAPPPAPEIVAPPPAPEIVAPPPAPEIVAPPPAPEIVAPPPAPEIIVLSPAPEIVAPPPAPEIVAPPPEIIVLSPAPAILVPPPTPEIVVPPPAPVPRPVEPARLRPPAADAPTATPERSAPAPPVLERPARRHRRRGYAVVVRALPTLAALAILSLAFLSPRNAPSLSEDTSSPSSTPQVARPVPPQVRTTPPTRPQAAASQRAKPRPQPAKPKPKPQAPKTRPQRYAGPTTLTWRPRAGTDYYVVELFLRGRLVHAASVRRPSFAVPAWLPKGRFDWRALAGTGAPSDRRTTGVVEHGWFIRS